MKSPLTLSPRPYTLLDAVGIPFRCAPVAAFFYGFFDLTTAAIVPLKTLVVAHFIDAAIEALRAGSPTQEVYINLGLIAAISAFQWFKQALHNFADLKLHLSLRERYRTALTEKRTRLAYRHIDNAQSWDLIQRIAVNPETGRLKSSYYHLIDLVSFIIKVGGLLLILTTAIWWGSLVVVVISALSLITGIRGGKLQYQAERDISTYDKYSDYYSDILLNRDAAAERMLFAYTPKVASMWRSSFLTAMKMRIRTRFKWYVSAYLGNLITQGSWIFIMIILLTPLLNGSITVGLFIALTQAFTSLNIVWGFMETVHGIAADNEFFEDLTEFLGLEEHENASPATVIPSSPYRPSAQSTLEIHDVSFSYPGSNNLILDKLSCTFEPGNHYALVGINGAGKTTLTRLLTGLYPVSSGSIRLNGIDIRDLPYNDLISHFSLVYQDFSHYQLTLKENILLGAASESFASRGGVDQVLDNAITLTGLNEAVNRLPGGVDTHIGKLKEDGMDLSGGEWQRIAMARCLVSPAPIRILDEPTAALDPVAESDLYDLFDRVTQDTTTIFISHRLGATKIADKILVLQDGSITEAGSHGDLMNDGGLYHDMFTKQRSWYEID